MGVVLIVAITGEWSEDKSQLGSIAILLNHLFIFVLFVFKDLVNSIGSGFVMIMLVSSAKSTGFAEVAMVFGRSFMYNIVRSD